MRNKAEEELVIPSESAASLFAVDCEPRLIPDAANEIHKRISYALRSV